MLDLGADLHNSTKLSGWISPRSSDLNLLHIPHEIRTSNGDAGLIFIVAIAIILTITQISTTQ